MKADVIADDNIFKNKRIVTKLIFFLKLENISCFRKSAVMFEDEHNSKL